MGTGEGMLLLIITIILTLGLLVVAAKSPSFKLGETNSTYIPTSRQSITREVYEPIEKIRFKCYSCKGTGLVKCSWCNGQGGKYRDSYWLGEQWIECFYCNGTGLKTCLVCDGKGYN